MMKYGEIVDIGKKGVSVTVYVYVRNYQFPNTQQPRPICLDVRYHF